MSRIQADLHTIQMMERPIPCTVEILVRNNPEGLRRCLESLRAFDEVLVQDGFSTDETRNVAQSFSNVIILDQNRQYLDENGRILDYAKLRNEGIKSARNPWIFVIDCDEFIGPEFISALRLIVERGYPGVYQAHRIFLFHGSRIEYCSIYPSLQIRLFHRSCVKGYVKSVHERLHLVDGVSMQLIGEELFIPLPVLGRVRRKNQRYLRMELERLGRISWYRWGRWILYRNLRAALGLLVRLIRIWVIPRRGKRMPLSYEWEQIRYLLVLIPLSCPSLSHYFLKKLRTASQTELI